MRENELNESIAHYVKEDKTRSAVMLTGAWGTGKSFYIQNSLKSFLEERGVKCIVVSLYGLKDLNDLSRSIYLEVRAKLFTKKSEKTAAGKILGKTIVKGVASFFHIDLAIGEKDLSDLYASVDLRGKLLILEDIERSAIDIFDILGYVNSIVEQDGGKVLLVANEEELLKWEDVALPAQDAGAKTERTLTEHTKRYLAEKEKTVGDTIRFDGDIEQAAKDIIKSYHNPTLNKLLKETDESGGCAIVRLIREKVMKHPKIECENLRAFLYACQKTADIFDSVENKLDADFAKRTFLSIVAFSLRKKQDDGLKWDADSEYSGSLGTERYPLLWYCYRYLVHQDRAPSEFLQAQEKYIAHRSAAEQKRKGSETLDILYHYSLHTEKEVLDAVKRVKSLLREEGSIAPEQYGGVAAALITIKNLLDCGEDVEACKQEILENLQKIDGMETDHLFLYSDMEIGYDADSEIRAFRRKMRETVDKKSLVPIEFDDSPEHLTEFCEKMMNMRNVFLNRRVFARKIDNDRLIGMLKRCSASQIMEVRTMYGKMYAFSNIDEVFGGDAEHLDDLRKKTEELSKADTGQDKIQRSQLRAFANDLLAIVKKLRG